MPNIEAQIYPNGISQRNLVDLLYMLFSSFKGVCVKLDLDDNTDNTYEAKAYTAIFNGYIEDSRGNSIQNRANDGATPPVYVTDERFFIITPQGIDDKSLLECLYQWFDMMETLTEQLDADDATTSNYEALIYTAIYLWIVENCKGSQLGNGTVYYFRPGGVFNYNQLIDLLYAMVYSWEKLTEKLDTDAVPAGSNYEALWFTATVTMRVQNSMGSVVGNTITVTP
ncbi:MAG TPA: hypothetical protein VLH56_17270 [Dissulfurispiraceae bacterium]|nr:hypothetical protein [Dissulfurispiraceae bacterium]